MNRDIASIRRNYAQHSLSEADAAADPIEQFDRWWKEAIAPENDEVNAMTLATASADAVPAARIVLLKDFSPAGFVFFTNYNSFKGRHLEENPKACLVFFWKELERQVRITGLVQKVDPAESDAYFYSRPQGSQLGASVSPQSQVIENREWLEARMSAAATAGESQPIRRPDHWGGYRVRPVLMEFWQGRPSRLHDRIEYSLGEDGAWGRVRLAP